MSNAVSRLVVMFAIGLGSAAAARAGGTGLRGDYFTEWASPLLWGLTSES